MSIKRIPTRYGHRYELDGQKADGVTTLINQGLPKPALVNWAARTVAEHVADHLDEVEAMRGLGRQAIVDALKFAHRTQRDEAARRGTEIHALAEKLIHGDQVDVPEEIEGQVHACVDFLDQWRVRPVAVERVIANRRWGYCGTFDLVADIHGPLGQERALIDYKSGRSRPYPDVAYQLAGYRHAEVYLDDDGQERPLTDLGIEATYAVWLRPDGYSLIPLDTGEATYKALLHIAYVARCARSNDGLVGEPMGIPEAAA